MFGTGGKEAETQSEEWETTEGRAKEENKM